MLAVETPTTSGLGSLRNDLSAASRVCSSMGLD